MQPKAELLERISAISHAMLKIGSVQELSELMKEHESLTAEIIQAEPVQQKLFPDFGGTIKSLGAWGGDFAWVTGLVHQPDYFSSKGYELSLEYGQMIFS